MHYMSWAFLDSKYQDLICGQPKKCKIHFSLAMLKEALASLPEATT